MEATAAKLISEGYYEGHHDKGHLDKTQQASIAMEIDPATGATTATTGGTDTGAGSDSASTSISNIGTNGTAGDRLTPKDVMIRVDKDHQSTRMHGDTTMVEW